LAYRQVSGTSATQKFLVMSQVTCTTTAASQTLYITLARSATTGGTASNFTNLANVTLSLTGSSLISAAGNYMGSVFNNNSGSLASLVANTVDATGTIGTFYYSVWVYNNTAVAITAENVSLNVIQIAY
jgi:hypothetical protein